MKLNWNIAVGLQILLENNGSLTFKEIAKNLGISKTQAYASFKCKIGTTFGKQKNKDFKGAKYHADRFDYTKTNSVY